jgi:rSAM/selenodomain-associated transferase 2
MVLPVYNESESIGVLLNQLIPLKDTCEIIFVDGGSTDDTVKQIEDAGFAAAISPKKGRANQMNHGATLTRGDIIWFVHVDSKLPTGALDKIIKAVETGCTIGCFRLKFDCKSMLMSFTAFCSNNIRTRLRNITFGDQGIFITRELFEEIGGYADIPLMEDYQLSFDFAKAGHRVKLMKEKIITSERRYRIMGRLKTIFFMWKLQRRFLDGEDIEIIAKEYFGKGETHENLSN